ncbi:MAG: hypothetical protein GY711_02160 [bacterium]|nr:hypothetical protein [bacterium]
MHLAATSLLFTAIALSLPAQDPAAPATVATAREDVVLGEGNARFRWIPDWVQLPDGMKMGNTHGCVAVDSKGRVYFNTDTENAVIVLNPDGSYHGSWGKELRGGLHGMVLVQEGDEEFLYLTHTGQHAFVKSTLAGEEIWRVGHPEASGKYENANQFRPTGIAVAPDGRIYVADGYGLSWIHVYDKNHEYVKSFGGPGTEAGKLRTPHGLLMDTRGEEPVLVVADRENNRLQTFSLDGEHLSIVQEGLRRPCNIAEHDGQLVVPDLAGRITILGKDNKLVAHLGDNPDPKKRAQNKIPLEQWANGEFLSPHGAAWDARGNLIVLDWNFLGRVTKLERLEGE